VWIEVFEDKVSELHKSGFVQRDIKSPSNISGLVFDNLLLTDKGLRLIDVGILALKS
jgi:serine/threonine protein kinase